MSLKFTHIALQIMEPEKSNALNHSLYYFRDIHGKAKLMHDA